MADPHADTAAHDHVHGQMDIQDQQSTYAFFTGLTKWGSLATAAILLFLTMWFAVGAGFIGAAIAAGVLTVIGVIVLREKPARH